MSEKKSLNFLVFKRLLANTKPYKRILFMSVACTILLSFLGPIRPLLIGQMVDRFMVKSKQPDMLVIWTFMIIGLLILESFLQFAGMFFSNLLAQSVIRDLRKRIFGHLLRFRMQYFDKTPIGSLVTRVVSDLEAITEVFSSGILEIAGDFLALIVVLSLMFWTNWQLTLMTLLPIPFLLIATRIFARAMQKSFQLERTQVNKLNTFVQEHLSGMSIVQLFNRQKQEYTVFEEINKGHRQAHVNAVWANSIFFPIVEMLSSLSIAFLIVWGAVMAGGKSPHEVESMYGQIFSFTLWIGQLYRPIRMLADKFNVLQRGTVRAERVFEILDMDEFVQEQGKNDHCAFTVPIRFHGVSFAYTDEQYVLKDINLEINPGSTVAFVGATGSGKTTMVNLLGRFYEYKQGTIHIGDVELRDIELNYLRSKIAVVLQDVFLFSDSIHRNITLGSPEITREQVVQAAKAVGADEFICQLPGGYDYVLGERGGVLSVGQRQLISFVRAFVYNPEILILDEATSSVDNESEVLIQKATEALTKGRTSIVIAHRLSTIRSADLIVVMDKGRIVEQGTHTELLTKEGYYRKLYDMQFSEEDIEE
jgi:ATP-binding cassette subfamily B protein